MPQVRWERTAGEARPHQSEALGSAVLRIWGRESHNPSYSVSCPRPRPAGPLAQHPDGPFGVVRAAVYLSQTFRTAWRWASISRPLTLVPLGERIVERSFDSGASLFAQYVAGYVGGSADRRGGRTPTRLPCGRWELRNCSVSGSSRIRRTVHGTGAPPVTGQVRRHEVA